MNAGRLLPVIIATQRATTVWVPLVRVATEWAVEFGVSFLAVIMFLTAVRLLTVIRVLLIRDMTRQATMAEVLLVGVVTWHVVVGSLA